MEPKTIKIDDVEYVQADSIPTPAKTLNGMRYCIARCKDAGVHAGYCGKPDGRSVTLYRSRRLWRWNSPDNTLSGLSQRGPQSIDECKFGDEVPEIYLGDMCELIVCSQDAVDAITGKPGWKFGGSK